jgi:arginine exporter protein ArgO
MVTALLVGLVVGFVLAIPPGPIAMACVQQGLAGQAREGLALVLGASAMDIVYALLAAFASSALVEALWGLVLHHAWVLLVQPGGKKFSVYFGPIRGTLAQPFTPSRTVNSGAEDAGSQATCSAALGG